MTEGAKTGTLERFSRYCEGVEPCPEGEFVRYADHLELLTEALKVAGELAGFTKHSSLCNGALNGRCTCGRNDALTALERIRNNKH